MNSFHKAFYHLQLAKELFDDARRQDPGTIAASVSKKYADKIDWMKRDLTSHPQLPAQVMHNFMVEMADDILFPAAIAEKVLQLPLELRSDFEKVLDMMLAGERITMQVGD